MLCSSSATLGPSGPWPKNLPLPLSCIMTDCKGVCVPVCHAWLCCSSMILLYVASSDCSLLSCQVFYTLFQSFLNIYFPFLCKQVFVLQAGRLIVLRIGKLCLCWNSVFPLLLLCVKTDATFLSYSFVIIVIINVILADPCLEDKQEPFAQLDSWLIDMSFYKKNKAAIKHWSSEVSGDNQEA